MPFYVYIIQSEPDGSYYIGSTRDLDERLNRHNQGRSKYTKTKKPWRLKYFEEYPNRSKAVKREKAMKNRESDEESKKQRID